MVMGDGGRGGERVTLGLTTLPANFGSRRRGERVNFLERKNLSELFDRHTKMDTRLIRALSPESLFHSLAIHPSSSMDGWLKHPWRSGKLMHLAQGIVDNASGRW
jgi:hypothetical protein